MLGPPIGGFLYQTYGYEVPFIFLGCVVLVMVPLNIFLLPNYGRLYHLIISILVGLGKHCLHILLASRIVVLESVNTHICV